MATKLSVCNKFCSLRNSKFLNRFLSKRLHRPKSNLVKVAPLKIKLTTLTTIFTKKKVSNQLCAFVLVLVHPVARAHSDRGHPDPDGASAPDGRFRHMAQRKRIRLAGETVPLNREPYGNGKRRSFFFYISVVPERFTVRQKTWYTIISNIKTAETVCAAAQRICPPDRL